MCVSMKSESLSPAQDLGSPSPTPIPTTRLIMELVPSLLANFAEAPSGFGLRALGFRIT